MTLPISVQTPSVHVDVFVCWQSAMTEQSCAWEPLHASTQTGVPIPPSAPHVWQHELGASHDDAPHATLCAPMSPPLALEELAGAESVVLASRTVVPGAPPREPVLEPELALEPGTPCVEDVELVELVSPLDPAGLLELLESAPHPVPAANVAIATALAECKHDEKSRRALTRPSCIVLE